MFGPELHHQNEQTSITLGPIIYEDLPDTIDENIKEYLNDRYSNFLTTLPNQYDWLKHGTDNIHWGIYSEAKALLGITGVRNLNVEGEPAISRIALFSDALRGKGIGRLAYEAQYAYLRNAQVAPWYEHSAANANVGSLRIAQKVGFVAVRRDAMRTTMHLRQP